jgi:hypothetical protein
VSASEWAAMQDRIAALEELVEKLAQAVVSIGDNAGMPDSFRGTDSRMLLARRALDELEVRRRGWDD